MGWHITPNAEDLVDPMVNGPPHINRKVKTPSNYAVIRINYLLRKAQLCVLKSPIGRPQACTSLQAVVPRKGRDGSEP